MKQSLERISTNDDVLLLNTEDWVHLNIWLSDKQITV